ncbi:ankyrin [Lentithecium fluviatile CBS 122367]|uniref:Ankyrin n=1 Tax=Lentithecium fluviatile CBS 122367 TaxID=1168545 RepID=A0A6G1IKZ8_9PLEO|nr:ankyrin [Lentithecium fluviatile CBS 122367]
MLLLDIPLDCFRYLIAFIARDFDYHENTFDFLSLRLINRTMNQEILRALVTPSFYQWDRDNWGVRTLETGPFFRRFRGSFPSSRERLPFPSSYPEFVASFIESKPHVDVRTPWNTNVASVIHHIVDGILSEDGLSLNDTSRKGILNRLCRQFLEMREWRTRISWWACEIYETSRMAVMHFPEETDSMEFNMLLASIVLGRRTSFLGLEDIPGLLTSKGDPLTTLMSRKSIVFGTLLEVCIKSGQIELVATLLNGVALDINDESFNALEMAVQSDNLDILHLLFSRYDFTRPSPEPTRIERLMRQAVDNDRTDAALYMIQEFQLLEPAHIQTWFLCAAMQNNFAFVEAILAMFSDNCHILARLKNGDSRWVLGPVVFMGHQDMLRFLLDRGFKCDHTTLMLAAVGGGHISMVRFLMNDCGLHWDNSASTWVNPLFVAVIHATPRHTALIETLFTDPDLFKKHNISAKTLFSTAHAHTELFRHACGHGHVFLVRKFAEAGVDLNHLEGYEDTPPLLVALLAGQTAVVNALIELGAAPIDPMKTKFSEGFEKGSFPEVWFRREVSHLNWRSTDMRPSGSRIKILRYR